MSCINFMKKQSDDNKKSIDDFTLSITKCDLIDNKLKITNRKKHKKHNNLYNNLYNKDECIICLNETLSTDKLRILKCKHVFHIGCIDTWLTLKLECPVCRSNVY